MPKKKDDVLRQELQKLAHIGTHEAIERIEELMGEIKDQELFDWACLSHDEACFTFLCPENEDEEHDLMLAKLVADIQERIIDRHIEVDRLKNRTKKNELDQKINDKLTKSLNEKQKEAWQYYGLDWEGGCIDEDLAACQEYLEYLEAKLEIARSMFINDKYRDLPLGMLDVFHCDDESDDDWDDDFKDECCCPECC